MSKKAVLDKLITSKVLEVAVKTQSAPRSMLILQDVREMCPTYEQASDSYFFLSLLYLVARV